MLSVAGNPTRKKYQTDTSERTEISFRRKEAKERKTQARKEKHGRAAKPPPGNRQGQQKGAARFFTSEPWREKHRKVRKDFRPLSEDRKSRRKEIERKFLPGRNVKKRTLSTCKGATSERDEIFRSSTEEERKPRLINMEEFFGTPEIPHGDQGLSKCRKIFVFFLVLFLCYFYIFRNRLQDRVYRQKGSFVYAPAAPPDMR